MINYISESPIYVEGKPSAYLGRKSFKTKNGKNISFDAFTVNYDPTQVKFNDDELANYEDHIFIIHIKSDNNEIILNKLINHEQFRATCKIVKLNHNTSILAEDFSFI